jgi:hypothetical protein
VIAAQPLSITSRYLQTLTEIAAEKNSTIVFPLPIEAGAAEGLDVESSRGQVSRVYGQGSRSADVRNQTEISGDRHAHSQATLPVTHGMFSPKPQNITRRFPANSRCGGMAEWLRWLGWRCA